MKEELQVKKKQKKLDKELINIMVETQAQPASGGTGLPPLMRQARKEDTE